MVDMVSQFLSMLTLVFAIASIIAGIFTAYFGSGKSRAVGGILIVIGILVFVIFLYGANLLSGILGAPEGILNFQGTVIQGVVAIVGAVVGAAIALGIFLLAIMKA
jgi:hypothetical protein